MKVIPDEAAVAAIASAALFTESDEFEPDCRYPEQNAGVALRWSGAYTGLSTDEGQRALALFDRTFAFALQLGARIGADPSRVPKVKDLVEKYRFELSNGKAA